MYRTEQMHARMHTSILSMMCIHRWHLTTARSCGWNRRVTTPLWPPFSSRAPTRSIRLRVWCSSVSDLATTRCSSPLRYVAGRQRCVHMHACMHAQSHTTPDSGVDDVRAPSTMRHGTHTCVMAHTHAHADGTHTFADTHKQTPARALTHSLTRSRHLTHSLTHSLPPHRASGQCTSRTARQLRVIAPTTESWISSGYVSVLCECVSQFVCTVVSRYRCTLYVCNMCMYMYMYIDIDIDRNIDKNIDRNIDR